MATDILRNALEVICGLANSHMQNLDRRGDDWIMLTSLTDQDGTPNPDTRDKIVMTVHNITADMTLSNYQPARGAQPAAGGDALARVAPPLYLDVHLMFAANFSQKNYGEGLAALSQLIGYFQQMPAFNTQNAPNLDPAIGQFALEFESLAAADLNSVMATLGTRYQPSAFYRLRRLPFIAPAMLARTYPVTQPIQPISG